MIYTSAQYEDGTPLPMGRLIAYDMALDCDEPTNNDLGPTPEHWTDHGSDYWWEMVEEEPWRIYADLIEDDPLLGVMLGAPHDVVMPEGCSRALEGDEG